MLIDAIRSVVQKVFNDPLSSLLILLLLPFIKSLQFFSEILSEGIWFFAKTDVPFTRRILAIYFTVAGAFFHTRTPSPPEKQTLHLFSHSRSPPYRFVPSEISLGHRIFHIKTYPLTDRSGRIKIAISDSRSGAKHFRISAE